MLVNPSKVVGIGDSKFRCWEYLPISTVPRDEATQFLRNEEFDTLELVEQYALEELENLENRAKEGFSVEAKKYEFNIPTISSKEIRNIVDKLSEYGKIVSSRVTEIL